MFIHAHMNGTGFSTGCPMHGRPGDVESMKAVIDWLRYSRTGGIRHHTNYPGNSLANTVTNPDRRPLWALSRQWMNENDGDEHGDVNQFWLDRDHLKDVDKVEASVFIVYGSQGDNVRFNHPTQWWDALERRKVPLKMWRTGTGHEGPFDFRRAQWVDTLHRWFDHWLQGVDNGIMDEPKVDIEVAKDTWATAHDWPIPATLGTDVYLHGTAVASGGFARE